MRLCSRTLLRSGTSTPPLLSRDTRDICALCIVCNRRAVVYATRSKRGKSRCSVPHLYIVRLYSWGGGTSYPHKKSLSPCLCSAICFAEYSNSLREIPARDRKTNLLRHERHADFYESALTTFQARACASRSLAKVTVFRHGRHSFRMNCYQTYRATISSCAGQFPHEG